MKSLANLATYILASPAAFCTKCTGDKTPLRPKLSSVYLSEYPFIYHTICIFFKAYTNSSFSYHSYAFAFLSRGSLFQALQTL